MFRSDDFWIKFVGTGGAFDTRLTNSSAIVFHQKRHLLIDCGHSVFPRLVETGAINLIDGVLITHLHDDHVGSLSSLILFLDLALQRGPTKVYVPNPEFQSQLRSMLSHSLGEVEVRVDFRPIEELTGVVAIDTFGRHVPWMQTWAFAFTDGDRSIVYSGDNGDAIFLDREIQRLNLPSPTLFHEVFFLFRMQAHAYYHDLMGLMPKYPIYGYHCDHLKAPGDNTLPLVGNFPELNF